MVWFCSEILLIKSGIEVQNCRPFVAVFFEPTCPLRTDNIHGRDFECFGAWPLVPVILRELKSSAFSRYARVDVTSLSQGWDLAWQESAVFVSSHFLYKMKLVYYSHFIHATLPSSLKGSNQECPNTYSSEVRAYHALWSKISVGAAFNSPSKSMLSFPSKHYRSNTRSRWICSFMLLLVHPHCAAWAETTCCRSVLVEMKWSKTRWMLVAKSP